MYEHHNSSDPAHSAYIQCVCEQHDSSSRAHSAYRIVTTAVNILLLLSFALTAKMKLEGTKKTILSALFWCAAAAGLWLFVKSGMIDYMLFRVPFAFLDYDKAGALVILENLLMLLFWAFAGTLCGKSLGPKRAK